ncbi:hypothetical protein OCU04_005685 [Sclerotinia nivalis]|uniref:Uncharacterized protein n=1 Tax=Sclerotinia nivalis TaxID=352851 RepID=A0A9X0APN4_9HELO|nr:hypothetical protein OCU04_005685 [Sclerotinia nivalis]
MNLPMLPSQTTALNTIVSPSMTPFASPPTITAWISNPEGGPKDACTTDRHHISFPVWAFIIFIALFVKLLIGRIRVAWELEMSQAKAACLESEQALNSFVANTKEATIATNPLTILEKHEIREQVWAETYQQDASRLMKIRALAEDANNALVLHKSTVHYRERSASEEGYVREGGYSRAANFIHRMLQREFERKYGVLSFQITTDAEGKYIPSPLYGPDKSLQESERWFEEGDGIQILM